MSEGFDANEFLLGEVLNLVADTLRDFGSAKGMRGALNILHAVDDINKINANDKYPDEIKNLLTTAILLDLLGSGGLFPADLPTFLETAWEVSMTIPGNLGDPEKTKDDFFRELNEEFPEEFPLDENGKISLPEITPEYVPPISPAPIQIETVNTANPDSIRISKLGVVNDYNVTKALSDPLVLDLDGNGIDLAAIDGNGSVYWDIDNDGFAEASAWVAGNDGLLAIDLNGDGIINDHSELFGTETNDGFSVLSAYDSNVDGVIDVNDAQFSDLIVWVDANYDGYSDASELSSLTDLGITSINLNATLVDYEIADNTITHESTFTINGQQQIIANAHLQYDNMNSVYNGDYTFDARVLDLPTLRGFGDIPDLFISMSLDETLLLMVQDLVSVDVNQMMVSSYGLQGKVENILYRWAGVESIDPDSRPHIDGISYIDARKLEFLEDYIGDKFEQEGRSNPNYDSADALELIFNSIVVDSLSAISSQTGGSSFYGQDASYNYINGEIIGSEDVDYISFNDPLVDETMYGSDRNDAYIWSVGDGNDQITETDGANDALWLTGGITEEDVRLEVYQSNDLRVNIGAESILITNQFYSEQNNTAHDFFKVEELVLEDGTRIDLTNNITFTGTDSADSVNGIALDDTLVGGLGDDALYGKEGNDRYVWSVGDGNDTIVEVDGVDQLVLHNVILSDIRLEAQWGYNLKVHIGGEFITINNQFYTDFSGNNYYDLYQVENLLLDDGTQLDLLNNLTFSGTDNSESINGLTMDDILIGGLGNDTLSGGTGDDTYVYALGDGNDIISETAGSDSIEFGAGITLGDLAFTQSGNNLLIEISDGSTIQVSNYYAYAGASIYGVEELRFADNSVVDLQVYLNTDPDAKDDAFIGDQDTNITGNLLVDNGNGADSDAENNTLSVVAGTYSTTNGSVTITSNGDFTYTPSSSYNGSDSFTYTLEDGFTGSDTATVNLTVRPPNVAPVAQDDVFSGDQDINITGNLLSNNGNGVDSDPDGDPLSVVSGTYSTSHGSVTVSSNGSFTYTPDSEYFGSDSFNYTLQDDRSGSDTGTVSIALNEVISGSNAINGTAAVDYLYGDQSGVSDDVITGFASNDQIYGYLGNDSYVWAVGDGNDTLTESGGSDQLILHSVLATEIRFENLYGYNLNVHIGSETITLNNQFASDYYASSSYDQNQIEKIVLDDATEIDLVNNLTFVGTSGTDYLYSLKAGSTLVGEEGNDNLTGYSGDDSYVWAVGDGNDTLTENGGSDQLILHDVTASEIRFENLYGYNLKVHIGSEVITLNNQFASDYYASSSYDQNQIEKIVLDDTTEISLLGGLTFNGTSGVDYLYSLKAGSTLVGEEGNDNLTGYSGDDSYVWAVGDGNDTLTENGGSDQLILHDVTASEIRFENLYGYNLKVHIGSETITLNNQFASDYYASSSYDQNQIEKIVLDDTTEIDIVNNLTFTGTSGTDYMYGLHAADTLRGEGGSDYLYGGDGDDALYGGAGVDMLYGQGGADTFIFEAVSAFTNSDNIQDFDLSAGDKLDISDLLEGYDPITDAITDFVQITESGGNSYLNVDANGGADNFVQVAYIYNETGLTDEAALETSGNLIAA